jgi:hypothetical protein
MLVQYYSLQYQLPNLYYRWIVVSGHYLSTWDQVKHFSHHEKLREPDRGVILFRMTLERKERGRKGESCSRARSQRVAS